MPYCCRPENLLHMGFAGASLLPQRIQVLQVHSHLVCSKCMLGTSTLYLMSAFRMCGALLAMCTLLLQLCPVTRARP